MVVELIKKIILNEEDIIALDGLIEERQDKVIRIFIAKVKKLELDNFDIVELIKSFILEFNRGNIISRYINGENICLSQLDSGIDSLITKNIQNNPSVKKEKNNR